MTRRIFDGRDGRGTARRQGRRRHCCNRSRRRRGSCRTRRRGFAGPRGRTAALRWHSAERLGRTQVEMDRLQRRAPELGILPKRGRRAGRHVLTGPWSCARRSQLGMNAMGCGCDEGTAVFLKVRRRQGRRAGSILGQASRRRRIVLLPKSRQGAVVGAEAGFVRQRPPGASNRGQVGVAEGRPRLGGSRRGDFSLARRHWVAGCHVLWAVSDVVQLVGRGWVR